MSNQPNPSTTSEEKPRLEGNTAPASLGIEFSEEETRADVIMGRFEPGYCDKPTEENQAIFRLECELTGEDFLVTPGCIVYRIQCDSINGYLHPKTVANGAEWLADKLRRRALMHREDAHWEMRKAVQLEAAAERGVEIHHIQPDAL